MIYRVGEHETNVYEQNRLKSAQTSSNGEKFNLNQYTQPDASEAEKEDSDIVGQHPGISAGSKELKRDGVVVQLSNAAYHSRKADRQDAVTSNLFSFQDIRALWEKLQNLANHFIRVIKDTFYRIWNDPPTEDDVGTEVTGAEKERLTEEYKREKNLTGYEQMMNTVTKNGERTLAKNSTLLTYYDRSGKLTQINASDKERILHGDRNTKKL